MGETPIKCSPGQRIAVLLMLLLVIGEQHLAYGVITHLDAVSRLNN